METIVASIENQRAAAEDVFGEDPGKKTARPNRGQKLINQRQREKIKQLIASHAIQPVTLVSFVPFEVAVNGNTLFQDVRIPACPIDRDFTTKVIDGVRWSMKDNGVGFDNVDNYDPIPHLPTEIAVDILREMHELQTFGGVFAYVGTGNPANFSSKDEVLVPYASTDEDGVKTVDLRKENFHALFLKTQKQAERSMMRRLQEATSNYQIEGKRNMVSDLDRDIARRAIHLNLIKEKPSFLLDAAAPGTVLPDPCPLCGVTPNSGAAICKSCNGYVFDPVRAYEAAGIEYGHVSFDRLDAEGWKKVNAIKQKRDKARIAAGGAPETPTK